jgi:large subunit ribosomal protein L46
MSPRCDEHILLNLGLQAAQRTLATICGVNMNTWFVGSHPIGHFVYQFRKAAETLVSPASTLPPPPPPQEMILVGEKTFFMKGRIMAGQADIKANELGVEDFKWLTKEEVQKEVSRQYWANVKNMLVEQ